MEIILSIIKVLGPFLLIGIVFLSIYILSIKSNYFKREYAEIVVNTGNGYKLKFGNLLFATVLWMPGILFTFCFVLFPFSWFFLKHQEIFIMLIEFGSFLALCLLFHGITYIGRNFNKSLYILWNDFSETKATKGLLASLPFILYSFIALSWLIYPLLFISLKVLGL